MKGSKQDPCCYRVSYSSSVTPFSLENGFTAHDGLFLAGATRPISGKAFKAIQAPSLDDPSLDESVVNHILGGWTTSYLYVPWISVEFHHCESRVGYLGDRSSVGL